MTRGITLALSTLVFACGAAPANDAPPATSPAVASKPDMQAAARSEGFADLDAAIAAIARDSRKIEAAVRAIAKSEDRQAAARADLALVEVAEWIASPAWRDAKRPSLVAANEASHLEPTDRQFAAQMQQYQDEVHASMLTAMAELGGPASVEHCRRVALDQTASTSLRATALRVVDRFAPSPALEAARADIAARRDPAEPPIPNAGAVVATLTPAFKQCWNAEIERNPSVENVATRLTLKIGTSGLVTSVTVAGLPVGKLSACLTGVVQAAKFDPPTKEITLVVPLSLALPLPE